MFEKVKKYSIWILILALGMFIGSLISNLRGNSEIRKLKKEWNQRNTEFKKLNYSVMEYVAKIQWQMKVIEKEIEHRSMLITKGSGVIIPAAKPNEKD